MMPLLIIDVALYHVTRDTIAIATLFMPRHHFVITDAAIYLRLSISIVAISVAA